MSFHNIFSQPRTAWFSQPLHKISSKRVIHSILCRKETDQANSSLRYYIFPVYTAILDHYILTTHSLPLYKFVLADRNLSSTQPLSCSSLVFLLCPILSISHHKYWIYLIKCQARPVEFIFVILYTDITIQYKGQTHYTLKTNSSRAASLLKPDNTIINKSLFNRKHTEISTKWHLLLHLSSPHLLIQALQQSSPSILSSM